MTNVWHIGLAVPDLAAAQQQYSAVLGVDWRPVVVRSMTVQDATGTDLSIDVHVTFSVGGPFAIELWQSIPGTPLESPSSGWFHHIGYWVDDMAAEGQRLAALGLPATLSRAGLPLLNAAPGGFMVEPCDLHRDQPYLRDLYPTNSEFFGAPELPSA